MLGDLHGALRRELPAWAAALVADGGETLAAAAVDAPSATERHAQADAAAWLREAAPRLSRALVQGLQGALGSDADDEPARAAPAALSLVDEDEIDAGIETLRLARAAEDAAERELQRLAPLASRLQRRDGVHAEAVPLPPAACARALRQALADQAPPRELRARLIAALGRALCSRLRTLYATQIRLLESWGVEPARYRIRQTVSAAPGGRAATPAPAHGPAGATLSPDLVASLNRLVAWAQRQPGADAAAEPSGELRLLDEPSAMRGDLSAAPRQLPAAMARQLMQHLVDQVESQAGSGTAPAWVAPMKAAGDRLATQSAEVFNDFQHPWWQLLDRLLAQAATQGGPADVVDRAIAGTLERLQATPAMAPRDVAAAVAQIDRATTDWMAQQHDELGAQAAGLADGAERQLLEDAIREQLVARLRSAPPPDGLRRFLLGPWAHAMADAALREGTDGRALAAQADCLERLLAAGQAPLPRDERRLLLTRVRVALETAELDAPRIEAELLDLAAVLRKPEPPREPWPEADAPRDTAPLDLATVPIDMYEQDAGVDREAWLDSLAPGDRCRLYLNDRWHTPPGLGQPEPQPVRLRQPAWCRRAFADAARARQAAQRRPRDQHPARRAARRSAGPRHRSRRTGRALSAGIIRA